MCFVGKLPAMVLKPSIEVFRCDDCSRIAWSEM
jgi:hypothetical protein